MFMFVLLFVLTTSVSAKDDTVNLVSGTTFLGRWLAYVLSRGLYGILVTVLIICFIVSAFKNKVKEKISLKSDKEFVMGGASPHAETIQGRVFFPETSHTDEVEAIKERLREAEIAMQALKCELEHANKSKVDLENTLENIERDKSLSEDELGRIRMAGVLEVENLRNESATVERQLQLAVEEKEELLRELEAVRREARISEWALKDQRTMSERLEVAQSEIKELRTHLKGLRVERDAAVRLASDLLERAKGIAHRSAHQRQMIEEMIDSELKRVREEEEAADREETPLDVPATSNRYKHTINDPNEDELKNQPDVGGGENSFVTESNILTETDNEGGQFITDSTLTIDCNVLDCPSTTDTLSMQDDDDIEETDQPHIVTGSPAFRAFLRNVLLEGC